MHAGIRVCAVEFGFEDVQSEPHDAEMRCQHDGSGGLQAAWHSQARGQNEEEHHKYSGAEEDGRKGTGEEGREGRDSGGARALEKLLDKDFAISSNHSMAGASAAENTRLDESTCIQMDIKIHAQPSDGEHVDMQEGHARCAWHQQLQDSAKQEDDSDGPHSHATKCMAEGAYAYTASADPAVDVGTILAMSDRRVNYPIFAPQESGSGERDTHAKESYPHQLWAQPDMALLRSQVFTSLLYGPVTAGLDEEDASSSSKAKRNRQRGTPNKPLGGSGGLEAGAGKEGKANVSWADPDEADDSWQEIHDQKASPSDNKTSPPRLPHEYLQCECLKRQRWCDSSCHCWCHVVIAYTGEEGAPSVCL
jgi:hypothetical protein